MKLVKLQKRVLLLTGSPGVGKSSVLLKIVEALKARGYRVGGMLSREVRSCGTRVGFEILDLSSGERGWLAHVNQPSGPRVGKYRVNLEDLDGVGVAAILRAVEGLDVVAVDEVGPMELFSERFREAVKRATESKKLVVGIIHWKARDKLINEIRSREDAEVHVVTFENRGNLHEVILEKAVKFLENT
ncbi:MAG: NTPase [Candidatus Bathyarchaeota archaeon]|nr:NTPase [Candidatus Bathyarchaeota archaeon A05DMB-5]MDH7557991.1 NTPase [Candidatus Bathyarchaeota archaeon]